MGGLKRKSSSSSSKTLAKSKKKKKKNGPHLPNSILKVIANNTRPLDSDDDAIDGGNLYECEEGIPEEESMKNNRYGRHENYDYELAQDFEDENVESEIDDDDDDDRHTRMLHSLTGMPSAAFEGGRKSKPLLCDCDGNEVSEAHRVDGDRLLELNELSIEDQIENRNRIAKMRSLLFRHELRSKRTKKIKSKSYRRGKNKDLKNSSLMDPEMAKEEALRQEVRRVEERMTLKHRNKGQWARNVLERGLDKRYKGTRAALAEQHQMGAELSRKMDSMRDGSSIYEEEEGQWVRNLLECGLDKRYEGTRAAIAEQYQVAAELSRKMDSMRDGSSIYEEEEELSDGSDEGEENSGGEENHENVSGRRVFGAFARVEAPNESHDNSDSENDMACIEDNNDIDAVEDNARNHTRTITEAKFDDVAGDDESEDSESEMVSIEIPCQAEIINRAFAGDDVVEEFEKVKQEVLNEEVPKPEKPVLLFGWGDWTNIQRKRGLSRLAVMEHEAEERKREEGLEARKDARLKHVIISEKVDKKAEKLHTKTLPFPYTSKEVFEHSMRMPIGPEFNPSTILGDLNRPQVVKKSGVIIKPVKFEEVNPNDEVGDEEHPRNHQKQRPRRQSKVKSK